MNEEEYDIGMYTQEETDELIKEMLKLKIREESIKDGKYEVIKNMLKYNFDLSTIEKLTNIPMKEIIMLKTFYG